MKRIFSFVGSCCLAVSLFAGSSEKPSADLRGQLQNTAACFVENKGQFTDMDSRPAPQVWFKMEAPGVNVFVTVNGLTYLFAKTEEAPALKNSKRGPNEKVVRTSWERVDMILRNAAIKKENVVTEGKSTWTNRYFLPNCPGGIMDVHAYEKITIKDVYPGIDWVLYNSSTTGFKYDFVVNAGADPSVIRLVYRAKNKAHIDASGNIIVRHSLSELKENAPASFVDGQPVPAAFMPFACTSNSYEGYDSQFAFSFPGTKFPCSSTLIIDPQLLWATFFGGTSLDQICSTAKDAQDNIFMSGVSMSLNYPTQNAGTFFQGTNTSSFGGITVITKFDNNGVLLWSTYYGGNNGGDVGFGITIDPAGNIFVAGCTESPNFPLQNAGTFFQGVNAGSDDGYILKFDNNGNRLWATYYGGSNPDIFNEVVSDASGNIFITGYGWSSNFPTQNAGTFYQGGYGGGNNDIYLLKFDNAGNRLWATYYGGPNEERGHHITTDMNGNVFVTGWAEANLPVQNAGTWFQGTVSGTDDEYILKFDNLGNRLWATYYGGSGSEDARTVIADNAGAVFVVCCTTSPNFPVQNSGTYFQGSLAGNSDIGITKFDNAGNRLWGTYFGGAADEYFNGFDVLSLDSCQNLFMVFDCTAGGTILQAPCDTVYYDNTYNGGNTDAVLAVFSNTGALQWSTYIGGDQMDFDGSVIVDGQNNIFLALWAGQLNLTSSTYPSLNPGSGAYFDNSWNGSYDALMIKFRKAQCLCMSCGVGVSIAPQNVSCAGGSDGSAAATASGGSGPYTYSWVPSGGSNATATGLQAGTYTCFATDAGGCSSFQVVIVTGPTAITLTTSFTQASCSGNTGTASVSASGGTPGYSYSWSNSQTTATATGLSSGTYSVVVTDANGCTQLQTVSVTANNPLTVTVSSIPTSCAMYTGAATANPSNGTAPYTYSWSNGQSTFTATGLYAGTYTVTVTDANGCSQTQTVVVGNIGGPAAAANASAAVILPGGSSQLTATGGVSYSWYPSAGLSCITCANPVATPDQTTSYCVVVTDTNGCTDQACVLITIDSPCGAGALSELLPNAFSPNNDLFNDVYCVAPNSCFVSFVLKVYDRWGEKVFETDNLGNCWDGTYKGQPLNTDVFVYYFDATISNGEKLSLKGNISLVR